MTDDTSPENLRKFLKSDDPALVRMGISLAKGAGVEITVKDFERFLKSDDIETIKTGIMLADEAGIGDEMNPVERVLLEKVMNLEQEEFAEIIKERSKSLETMQDPCTAEDIIGLLSGSSAQARWIVACGVVEISCYDSATIDKIFENPINIFWSEISTYTDLITRADCDEIANVLNRLPPVLISQIGGGLYNFALAKSKEANAVCKQNRRKVTTIFEDPGLAKVILSRI